MLLETPDQKLASLQILRGIAALAVVLAHIWPMMAAYGQQDLFPKFIIGAAGVDLFFVISGFVIVYASERLFGRISAVLTFLWHRIIRIVPIYWLMTIITLLYVVSFIGEMTRPDLTWSVILGSFFFVPVARPSGATFPVLGVGWTLNYEMFFYLIFSISVFMSRRMAVISSTALLLALLQFSSTLEPLFPVPHWVLVNTFLYEFIFGMWIAIAYREGIRLPAVLSCAMIPIGLATMIYADGEANFPNLSRHWGWGGGVALIVAGCVLANVRSLPERIFWRVGIKLGDASYALYLVHAVIPMYFAQFLAPYLNPVNHPYLYISLYVASAISAALLLHHGFEWPVARFLRTITFGRSGRKVLPAAD